MKLLKLFSFILIIITVTACSSSLNGTYVAIDQRDAVQMKMSFEFISGKKLIVHTAASKTELGYSIEGDKLKLGGGKDQSDILDIRKDGNLILHSKLMGDVIFQKS